MCTFNSPNVLKRLPDIVDLNQVFKRLAVENERSGVQDVEGLAINKLQRITTLGMSSLAAVVSFKCL